MPVNPQKALSLLACVLAFVLGTAFTWFPPQAEEGNIQNASQDQKPINGDYLDTVVIGALDKVTARTSEVVIKVGETVKIGSLAVTPLKAWRSSPEEKPESKVFLEIVDHGLDGTQKKIFRAWMFSSTPSISSLEHPVYDIWIIDVKGGLYKPDDSQAIDDQTNQKIEELIDQLIDPDEETDGAEK